MSEFKYDDLKTLADVRGVKVSTVINEFIDDGIKARNLLLEHVTEESEKTEKKLDRLLQIVYAHLYLTAGQDKEALKKVLEFSKRFFNTEQQNEGV